MVRSYSPFPVSDSPVTTTLAVITHEDGRPKPHHVVDRGCNVVARFAGLEAALRFAIVGGAQ